jgi:hypothetical protein
LIGALSNPSDPELVFGLATIYLLCFPAEFLRRLSGNQIYNGRRRTMSRKAAKHRQKPPSKRALYKPQPTRARVVALHVAGQSNRQIASAEGIDRDTVCRILSQPEVTQLIAQYQARLLNMVPKAIGVYEEALNSDNLPLATATATKLLEGTHVLNKGAIEQALPEPNHHQLKRLFLGQMMEMMLYKKQQYGIPLPQEFDSLENEMIAGIEGPAM